MTPSRFRRPLAQAVALPLILLAAVGALLAFEAREMLAATIWERRTDEVLQQAALLERLVGDVEVGVRGFHLTSDVEYLEPYRLAVPRITEVLNGLARLVSDNPIQSGELRILRPTIERLLSSAAPNGRAGGSAEPMLMGSRTHLLTEIRLRLEAFCRHEEHLKLVRRETTERRARSTALGGLGLLLVAGVLLGLHAQRQVHTATEQYQAKLRDAERSAVEAEERRRQLLELNAQLERRVAERTADAEARAAEMDRLLEQLPLGVVLLRGPEMVRVNGAFARLLGRTPPQLLGRSPAEFVHPDDRACLESRTAQRSLGVPLASARIRFLTPEGQVRVLESMPESCALSGSAPVVCRDVTEEKSLHERLLLADRLASVGQLAAGVAHEVNNPLAAILANLSLALELLPARLPPSAAADPLAEMLSESLQCAERIRAIVLELVNSSRVEDDAQVPVDLAKVLDSALQLAGHELRGRAEVLRAVSSMPQVIGNAARLTQVFFNLLLNAAHAVPEGDPRSHQIRVIGRRSGDRAVIEVQDTGCGIAQDQLVRIFDPFFTTRPVGSGAGLGLSVCHSIVAQHGGEISAESQVGAGSTFRVSLPAAQAQLTAAA